MVINPLTPASPHNTLERPACFELSDSLGKRLQGGCYSVAHSFARPIANHSPCRELELVP